MARSSYSVVAININSLLQLIAPLRCSVNKRELLLVIIYVQGKIFQGNLVSTKIFYLEFFINEIFSVKKFPNYGMY